MKLTATVEKDTNGRLTSLQVRKGRQKKGVRLDFVYGQDGFVRDISFEGRRDQMPSIPDIIDIVNESFIERIGTINTVNVLKLLKEITTIKNIESIETIGLTDLTQVITEVKSVDVVKSIEGTVDPYSLSSKSKVLDKLALTYDAETGDILTVKGYEGEDLKFTLTFTWTDGALTEIVRT